MRKAEKHRRHVREEKKEGETNHGPYVCGAKLPRNSRHWTWATNLGGKKEEVTRTIHDHAGTQV